MRPRDRCNHGGSFEGERLSGEVVTGNDWQPVRTDSCIKLDVRLELKTTDEAPIVTAYQCLRAGPPGVIERLDKGEAVNAGSYYLRRLPLGVPIEHLATASWGHQVAMRSVFARTLSGNTSAATPPPRLPTSHSTNAVVSGCAGPRVGADFA